MRPTCWRDLPYREIWAVDTEYYPGPGQAHGGRDGDLITPLCLVAVEMRSGRIVRRWQDELGPFPPYRLDDESLLVTYMATAEFGFHQALSWGQPARAVDAYIEFRHLTNDARVKSGNPPPGQRASAIYRPPGYYALAGALRFFGGDEIDTAHKAEMRDRIIEGPPFSNQERADILRYCEEDARALADLATRLLPQIPLLPHALFRAQYAWAAALEERRGPPIDQTTLDRIRDRWDAIRTDLVTEVDRDFRCFEIVDGKPHFRDELFLAYTRRARLAWPVREDGKLDLRTETFREMAPLRPGLRNLYELRAILAQLRKNTLAVGRDGRNRTLLGPYGTKTGRNAPAASKYIFGPAKCFRQLIVPPPGIALIHRDYSQQEVRIAAALSGCPELAAACEGDVYLGLAALLGFPLDRPGVRDLFKTVTLGIQYGLQARSLAQRTGLSLYEAGEILARLKARLHVFEEWCAGVADHAGLNLKLSTVFGWTVQCPPGTPARTIRNWPIQSAGAEILHVTAILAERRGIRIVAPIHDAFLAEAPVADVADISIELDRVMREASQLVLNGSELPTSDGGGPILPGQRFHDERGADMWAMINQRMDALDRRTA